MIHCASIDWQVLPKHTKNNRSWTFFVSDKYCAQSGCHFNWSFSRQCISMKLVLQVLSLYQYIGCCMIIDAVNGVGNLFVFCCSFEFMMAQSPNRMSGNMIGLSLTVLGTGGLRNDILATILRYFPTATPSCVFYYYLVLSLLMLLILVVYVVLAKHYKMREREIHQHTCHSGRTL